KVLAPLQFCQIILSSRKCLQSQIPKPVVTINPANQVFRGESVTLRCDLRGGGGFDWTYSWYKKGNTVSLYSSTQDYEISSVSDSHRGEYTCIGTVRGTSRYSHTSTAVRLTVSATLTVDPDSTVFTGESVTLKCEITGYDGWRYKWYKQKNWDEWSAVYQSGFYTVNRELSNRPTSSQNKTPKPELTSSLKGAALIGNPVTLYCNLKQSAGWTGRGDPVYYTHYSDALWVNVTGDGASVALGVSLGLSLLFLIILGLICYYKIKKG
uniref:Ig-like domain-containing protein n=1 Tax=Astyanax mexicanus TaxID=7994 RepID=A0A3B1J2G4_ASTMX